MGLDADRLGILTGHYEQSFQKVQEARKARDAAFTRTLIVLLFASIDLYSPGQFGKMATDYLAATYSTAGIDLRYISTLVWLLLTVFALRYLQLNVGLDRQYDYLHRLEGILSTEFPTPAFTREGTSYLKDYPAFSNWVHYVYTLGIPVVLLSFSSIRFIGSLRAAWPWSAFEYVDLGVTLVFVATIILYMIAVHVPRKRT